ncbi:MAG: DUF86 domain-containing protein [Cyanobacteria bacterium P01_A01_bin.116]
MPVSKNRDLQSLIDIEQAANKAAQFLKSVDGKEAFVKDEKTQSAVVFQLLIIGEATKRLSRKLRQQYPDLPWSLMAGMRDNMIHEYDDIDVEQVWKTVKSDIPNLLFALKPVKQGVQQLRLQLEDES